MSAWKDLPNDKHIDWVLESLKTHPQLWHDTHNKEWAQARGQAWRQARDQAWRQARLQAWKQAYNQAYDQAWGQASYACLALIAYDDSVKYLSMTSDQLKVWIELSEDSAAILLLPMVQVKEKLNQLTSVV
jgi:hypothetical protein